MISYHMRGLAGLVVVSCFCCIFHPLAAIYTIYNIYTLLFGLVIVIPLVLLLLLLLLLGQTVMQFCGLFISAVVFSSCRVATVALVLVLVSV